MSALQLCWIGIKKKITLKHKKKYVWEAMDLSPLYVVHRGHVVLISHCTDIPFKSYSEGIISACAWE